MVSGGASLLDLVLHGLAGVAALGVLSVLPGRAWLARRLPAGTPALERWALHAGVGFWGTACGTALLFLLPVQAGGFRVADAAAALPFLAAAILAVAGWAASRALPAAAGQPPATRLEKAVLGLTAAFFLLFFLGLEVEYTAPTCLYRSILGLLGPARLLDEPDAPILLLGLVSTEQLGGVFAAFSLAAFSQDASMRLLNGTFAALVFLTVAALGRRLSGRTSAGLLASLLLMATGDVWLSEIGNVNMVAAQAAGLFLLLLHPAYGSLHRTRAFVFGALVMSRYVAVVGGLALLIAAWRDSAGRPLRRRLSGLAVDAVVVLVATLPMHVYHLAFLGSPLAYMGMEEYPGQAYEVLGVPFSIRAMMNAPLYDHLVRTPFNPFPMWIGWPLHAVQQWGALGLSLCALGLAAALRRPADRPWWQVAAVFAVPIALVLGVQENWFQPEKMTVAMVLYPVAAGFAAIGVRRLLEVRSWRSALLPAGVVAATCLAQAGGLALLRPLEFPEDPRFRQAYPRLRAEEPAFAEWMRGRWLSWKWTPLPETPGVLRALPRKSLEAMANVASPALAGRTPSIREMFMVRAVPHWDTQGEDTRQRPPFPPSEAVRELDLDLRASPTVADAPLRPAGRLDPAAGALLEIDLSDGRVCTEGPPQGVRVPFSDQPGPVVACRAREDEVYVFVATSPAQPFPTENDAYRAWLAGETPERDEPPIPVAGLRLRLPEAVRQVTLVEVLFLGPARHYLRRVQVAPDGSLQAGPAEVWRHN